MISRLEVFAIAEHYPETYRKLRMYVCKVALWQMIQPLTLTPTLTLTPSPTLTLTLTLTPTRREKKQLDELRDRFPDTLGALLNRLYGAYLLLTTYYLLLTTYYFLLPTSYLLLTRRAA